MAARWHPEVTSGTSPIVPGARDPYVSNMGLYQDQAEKARNVGVNDSDRLQGIRGWLLVIVGLLAYQLIHGLVLTGGAIILYNDPSLATREDFSGVPLGGLLLYVTTNVVLAIYAIVVLALMLQRKRAAISNCIMLSLLWPCCLIIWQLVGEKSHFGTIVDVLPNIVILLYVAFSQRVKATFVK